MHRLTHLRLAVVFAMCVSFCPSMVSAAPQIDSTYGPLPVFELHSGFWINLHHTLYFEAKQRSGSAPAQPDRGKSVSRANPSRPALQFAPDSKPALTAAEQRAWDQAVSFYVTNYADKDLLFNTELTLLKNQLGDFEECDELSGTKKKTCDAGLPANLTQILESAAAVYRTHQWPTHDRANRAWIRRVAPLVREQGVGLSQRLADIYQTRWPTEKIRVDVVAFASWAGAYTTVDPLRVTISSTDSRNQGSPALEVLFHEASHGIARPVEQAIVRECRQREKPIPRDLWHALIFYTTGEVIKPIMDADSDAAPGGASASPEYTPYAVREGLYQRGWEDYLKLLTKYWQPYLDGHTTFDNAIAHMVSAL
jgi:hypothetical protein